MRDCTALCCRRFLRDTLSTTLQTDELTTYLRLGHDGHPLLQEIDWREVDQLRGVLAQNASVIQVVAD